MCHPAAKGGSSFDRTFDSDGCYTGEQNSSCLNKETLGSYFSEDGGRGRRRGREERTHRKEEGRKEENGVAERNGERQYSKKEPNCILCSALP